MGINYELEESWEAVSEGACRTGDDRFKAVKASDGSWTLTDTYTNYRLFLYSLELCRRMAANMAQLSEHHAKAAQGNNEGKDTGAHEGSGSAQAGTDG